MIENITPSDEIKLNIDVVAFINRVKKIQIQNPDLTLKQVLNLDKKNNPDKYPWEYE